MSAVMERICTEATPRELAQRIAAIRNGWNAEQRQQREQEGQRRRQQLIQMLLAADDQAAA